MALATASEYQVSIFNWILNGSGDAVVNAVAGAGKTTTLVEAAALVKGTALFVAFNVHIKDELNAQFSQRGIANMRAMTIHGFGFKACSRAFTRPNGPKLNVDDSKYRTLAQNYVTARLSPMFRAMLAGEFGQESKVRAEDAVRSRVRALVRLVSMVRLTRTPSRDRNALVALMARYDITTDSAESDSLVLDGVRPLLDQGIAVATSATPTVDYTDMIWLPVVLELRVDRYQWIFVDECQDVSACAREFLLMARGLGGRILFVGDRNQAIMGFAGADANSFDRIAEITNATQLPLSVCYRCPSTHLALARRLVPQIEDAPGCADGIVSAISEDVASKAIGEGALVLSRKTAPLIGLCLDLIKIGKPARVRGRDTAKMLVEVADTVQRSCELYGGTFSENLDRYEAAQIERLSGKDNAESRIETVQDTCAAMRVFAERFGDSYNKIVAGIEEIFADAHASIWLSTVHRAKGLGADDVFILYPDDMPLVRAGQTPEDAEQERNILYVALTRGKRSLTLIGKSGTPIPADPGEWINA